MNRLPLIALLLTAPAARAFESTCRQYPDLSRTPEALAAEAGAPCSPAEGPNAARQRWIGPLDEHRRLWETTRTLAGLPASVSATVGLRVFTSAAPVPLGATTGTSLTPRPFAEAARAQTRWLSIGELAQLPDFSYSLWDWAEGNEGCPLPEGGTAEECHAFSTHMGPVNANHFPPLAQRFYARYHALALERAAQCKAVRDALAPAGARLASYGADCELEALALEAVGQHYLQDAWSSGHMWQRWGSAELADFPGATADDRRDRAVVTALVAGMIHGARGVLQLAPDWTGLDVNDAMCAPSEAVQFVTADGTVARGLGDDYLGGLPPYASAPAFDLQSRSLFSCAASGLLAVYTAAGEQHGPPSPPSGDLISVDPTGPACFGQRATNAALLAGEAVNLKAAGQQQTIPLDARLVSWMLPKVARVKGSVPVATPLRNHFRFSLSRVVSVTRLLAAEDPLGTEAAEGRLGEFVGVAPNGAYDRPTLATYLEPPLPWPATPDSTAASRAESLALLFHRAHAADWCARLGDTALEGLKARVQEPTLDAPTRSAACEVCTTVAERHLRLGAPGAYDVTQEPVCAYLAPGTALLYQTGSPTPTAAASAWCGCP